MSEPFETIRSEHSSGAIKSIFLYSTRTPGGLFTVAAEKIEQLEHLVFQTYKGKMVVYLLTYRNLMIKENAQ